MPPAKVLISTCLSCPFASFFTFTLHAGTRSAANMAPAAMTNTETLFLPMLSSSAGNLKWALDAGAPPGDIRNAHGKMPANGDFAEQRLDCRYFRNCRVGKRAHVVLDLRKIRRQIRIPHSDHRGFSRGTI